MPPLLQRQALPPAPVPLGAQVLVQRPPHRAELAEQVLGQVGLLARPAVTIP